jgi:transcription antitermination factor NusG
MDESKEKELEKPKRWYVIFTKHNCEKKLQSTLEANGYNAYVPVYSTIRQWSDRKKKVIVPLINSVVFVQVPEIFLNDLYNFSHVKGILKELGKPAIVRDYEIENLKIIAKEWNGEAVSTNSENKYFEKGDKVEVLRGPFAGIYGELVDINGKHRVVVRLKSMNVEFVINVPLNAVKKSSGETV